MRLFATGTGKLEEISPINFKNEREIQRTVEKNIDVFFPDLEKVQSECKMGDKRMDTLAFDKKAKAFVIIEYKTSKHSDIYSQGRSYYNTLRKNRDRCVLLLSQRRGRLIDPKDIDWRQTHLIFVMPRFTDRQIEASDSEDLLDIKLYEIQKYSDHLTVSRVGATDERRVGPVDEPLPSSEADWLDPKDRRAKPLPEIRDLYFTLKNILIDRFQLQHIQRKRWASFRLEDTEVCSVVLRQHKLQITYSTVKKDLLPLNNFVKDVSRVGRWGRGNYRSDLATESDISKAIEYVSLVCQDVSGFGHSGNKLTTTDRPDPTGYSEADWIKGKHGPKPSPEIRDLYFALKKALLDEFQLEHFQYKRMASFRLAKETQVCSVVFLQRALRITYATSKKDLLPPNDFIRDVSNKRNLGIGCYRSDITKESDLSMALECVGRVYRDKKPE